MLLLTAEPQQPCNNNFSALEVHIGVVNGNIELLNRYVMDNRAILKNRGHNIDVDDMFECILNVYLLAEDNKFHAYIMQIKTGIDDGSVQHTTKQLLNKAFKFYKLKKTREHGANNLQNTSRSLLSKLSLRS